MARTISGIFPDRRTAEHAAADLQIAGFAPAQLDLIPQEHPGPTDIGGRLKPTRRSIAGAVIGLVVLGAVGWLLGWLITLPLPDISHSATAGPLWAAIAGAVVGALVGSILATRAPVEEGYYREERIERGVTRLAVDAGAHEDEARQILRRNGARDLTPAGGDDRSDRYDANTSPRATS